MVAIVVEGAVHVWLPLEDGDALLAVESANVPPISIGADYRLAWPSETTLSGKKGR
jgi:hypothetical protein